MTHLTARPTLLAGVRLRAVAVLVPVRPLHGGPRRHARDTLSRRGLDRGAATVQRPAIEGEDCTGKCVVRWLTVYDEYDGAARTHDADVALVPTGLEPGSVDLRGEGDWYIGVQANDGEEAHYELSVSLVEPPPQPQRIGCDGYGHFCAPPFAEESAAPRRAHASASLQIGSALVAAAALAAAAAAAGAAAPRRSRDRRPRRHADQTFKRRGQSSQAPQQSRAPE